MFATQIGTVSRLLISSSLSHLSRMSYSYKFLAVSNVGDGVLHVQLNRPNKLNALNPEMWNEIGDFFTKIDTDEDCRVAILSGNGRTFTCGIDLPSFSNDLAFDEDLDVARRGRKVLRMAENMSSTFTSIEKCCKPVIAAIHGHCIGGGIDITSACDFRYCAKDANFSVKIVGNHGWLREVCMSGRDFGAKEALDQGYVSLVCENYDAVIDAAKKMAKTIATNSPVAVQGTKIVLNYARDHPVDDSLRYVAMWNMSQIQTNDVAESAMAIMSKGPKPNYAKL